MPARATTTRLRKPKAWRAMLQAACMALLSAGVAQAQSFSAAPVLFPATGGNNQSPQPTSITVTAPSTIRSITIPLPLAAVPEFTLVDNGGCVEDGTTVNATGTVCNLVVQFHPQYAGIRTATLVITDGAGRGLAVPITGTGYRPQIAIFPAATRIVAGTGPASAAATGDGDAAILATLNAPRGVAADSFGNLYIADTGNNLVRMLDAFGNLTTVAGSGTLSGASADGGPATAASLSAPTWLAVDAAGNLYIAETGSHVIRRVAMSSSRTITTIAGTYNAGSSGDGYPAITAKLNAPTGLAFDTAGNLYIADSGNFRIRRVDGATGYILAFAGSGTSGFTAVSTPAASAQFSTLAGLTLDTAGNLFVADAGNHVLREVSGGNVTVVAGNGSAGSSANGTVAISANLGDPEGLAVTPSGDIFFTDATAGLVRKVRAADGTLETVVATAGKSNGFTSGVRPSNTVSLNTPLGLTFDPRFTLSIADSANNVIRALSPFPGELNFAAQAVGNTSAASTVRVVNIGNADLTLNGIIADNSTTNANFKLNTNTTDSCGTTLAVAALCSYTIAFSPQATGTFTGEFNIAYNPTSDPNLSYNAPVLVSGGTLASLSISPGSLSAIPQNQSASIAITASGYFGTVALDIEGTLPPGLTSSVSGAVLTLSGTPTTVGTFPVTVFATDSLGATATQSYMLKVTSPGVALNVTEAIHITDAVSPLLSLSLNISEAIHVTDSPRQLLSLALNVNEAIHVTDTPNALLPLLLAVTEAIHVTDAPKQVLSLLLNVSEAIHVMDTPKHLVSLALNVNEAIHVTDTPTARLPLLLSVTETIHVADTPKQVLSLLLNVNEAIHVSDAPKQVLSLLLNVNEAIHITDTPKALLPVNLAVTESIHVTDTPKQTPSLLLAVSESIHVTDTPKQVLSLLLTVNEAIHVTDAPKALLPALLNVSEAIHVTDTPKQLLSLLLNVQEAIHVADTPKALLPLTLTVSEPIHVADAGANVRSTLASVAEAIRIADVVTLTKGPAPQTITAPVISAHIYGDSSFLVAATASSGLPVSVSVTTGPASLSGSTLTITGAGTITLNFTQSGNATTQAAPAVAVTFSVAKATANIRALDATRVVGQPNPSFLFTLGGLVRGDAATVVSGLPSITTTASLSSLAGPYPITPTTGTLSAANYTFSFTPGTLTLVAHVAKSTVFLVGGNGVSSLTDTGSTQSTAISAGGTGAAVDANGFVWSIDSSGTTLAKFNSSGALVADYGVGLTGATALAIDGSGQVWITGNSNTVSVLANNGTLLSTTSDLHISGATGVAIDSSGSAWISSGGNSTIQQIIGGAAPTAPPAAGLTNGTTGTRP